MKKQKMMLTVSAAAVFLASAPAQADIDVKIGGIVQAYVYLSDDGAEDDPYLKAGDVRLQVKAEKDGGFISYRIDADGLSNEADKPLTGDSITIGYKGDFGQIEMGEVKDIIESYTYMAGDVVAFNGDLERHIGYTRSFGGVNFGLAFSPEANTDYAGAAVSFKAGPATIGIGYEKQGEEDATSVGLKTNFGGLGIGGHLISTDATGGDIVALGLSYKAGSVGLALKHHKFDDDKAVTRFDASVPVSGNLYAVARYQNTEEGGVDSAFTRVGLSMKF